MMQPRFKLIRRDESVPMHLGWSSLPFYDGWPRLDDLFKIFYDSFITLPLSPQVLPSLNPSFIPVYSSKQG